MSDAPAGPPPATPVLRRGTSRRSIVVGLLLLLRALREGARAR